jgi:RHS repeat-associated protein
MKISMQSIFLVVRQTVLVATMAFALSNATPDAFCQTVIPDSMPSGRGIVPTGTYSVSDIETVDVATGNVFYKIPITSLPPGRAGWSADVNLTYNSQIWDLTFSQQFSPTSQEEANYEVLQKSFTGGGWQLGFTYSVIGDHRPWFNEIVCNDYTNLPWLNERLTVLFPDGSRHTLHLYPNTPSSNSPGEVYKDYFGEGYYDVYFNGSTTGCPQSIALATGKVTYYTTDGTYVRVVFDNTPGATVMWTMYFADGRTVAVGVDGKTRMYDRNGNTVTITNVLNISTGTATTTLADDLGRTITINYGSLDGTMPDSVTQVGADGTTLTWTINWRIVTPASGLGYRCSSAGDSCWASNLTSSAISSVSLPTGQTFQFGYDTAVGWGELNSVTLPSGASVTYQYSEEGVDKEDVLYLTSNPVKTKTLSWTDQNFNTPRTETTSYCLGFNLSGGSCSQSTVTKPDGGQVLYSFSNFGATGPQFVAKITQPDKSTQERIWAQNPPYTLSNFTNNNITSYPGNPYVQYEVNSVASNGAASLSAVKSYLIDRNGNQTTVNESDWTPYSNANVGLGSSFSPPPSIRTTNNTYSVTTSTAAAFTTDDPNGYFNPGMNTPWGLLTHKSVTGAGPGSSSSFEYGDTSGHPNLVTEQHFDTQDGWLKTSYTYDANGNLLSITNPMGYITSYAYASDGICLASKTIANMRHFSYSCGTNQWDLISAETDADQGIATTYIYDSYGRTTRRVENGGPLTRTTATTYNDTARTVTVASDLNTNGDGAIKRTTYYDQLGRVRQTTDPVGNNVQTSYYNGTPNSSILTSNPYQTTGDLTMGWTLTTLDHNGRTQSVQHLSGATGPSPWGNNTSSTGTSNMVYGAASAPTQSCPDTTEVTGAWTVFNDEAGVSHTSYSDGLGRIVALGENSLGKTTYYCWDALDDLTSVTHPIDPTQSRAQTRTFSYTSTKRLWTASNPETSTGGSNGTATYTYDANGNLATRLFGGVTTTYGYDPLDQLTQKTYGDPKCIITACASYSYLAGRRSSVVATNAAGTTTTTYGYDALGRVAFSTQNTNNTNFYFSYLWNLADGLTTVRYPSGRTLFNGWSNAGQINSVQLLQTQSFQGKTYASNINYAPHGALSSWFGGDGVTRAYTYNPRLENSTITATAGSTLLLGLTMGYSPTADNGNLQSETITRPGFFATQNFYYMDGTNRLTSANEGSNWSQTYIHDVVGNQALFAGSSVIGSNLTPQTSSVSSVPFTYNNQWMLAAYDPLTGNMTSQSTQSFVYDAEQRLIQQTDTGYTPNSVVNFSYDGDGRRTTKTLLPQGTSTTYVYDAMGNLAAEYGGPWPTAVGTLYLTQDHLGSTRLTTTPGTSAPNIIACHDYVPFGQEIPSTWGRAGASCYNQTLETSIKFTGKERDAETGLDYFGARYFSGAQGRFTSPDPLMASAHASNPQTWNRYAYALNNPLRFVDPNGMEVPPSCANDQNCPISVKINVIYDKTIHNGNGLTSAERSTFEKDQLAKAQKDYSNSNINLQVSYTEGSYTGQDANGKPQVTGLQSDALNIVVSNATPNGRNVSNLLDGSATTFINFNDVINGNYGVTSNSTEHELGHQFLGDPFSPGSSNVAVKMFQNFLKDDRIDTMNTLQQFGQSQAPYRTGLEPRVYAVPTNPEANKPQK